MRDPAKLRVFAIADQLVVEIYRATRSFPAGERLGLQTQMRRAAVSAASNIVEGCARRTTREYLSFLNIATASSAEVRYLVDLSFRLGFLAKDAHEVLMGRCTELLRRLQVLIRSLENRP